MNKILLFISMMFSLYNNTPLNGTNTTTQLSSLSTKLGALKHSLNMLGKNLTKIQNALSTPPSLEPTDASVLKNISETTSINFNGKKIEFLDSLTLTDENINTVLSELIPQNAVSQDLSEEEYQKEIHLFLSEIPPLKTQRELAKIDHNKILDRFSNKTRYYALA